MVVRDVTVYGDVSRYVDFITSLSVLRPACF